MRAVPFLVLLMAACDFGGRGADVQKAFEPLDTALLATVESESEPAVFHEKGGKAPGARVRMTAHDGAVTEMAFVTGTTLATVSWGDKRICLWDVTDGTLLGEAENEDRLTGVAARPGGTAVLTVDAYGYLVLWPIANGTLDEPEILNEGQGEGSEDRIAGRVGHHPRIAVSPNGRLAAVSTFDKFVTVWDLVKRIELRRIASSRPLRAIAFASDGVRLAVGGTDNTWTLYDLSKGAVRTHDIPKVAKDSDVSGIAFNPSGSQVATGHMDSSLTLWSARAGAPLQNWFVRDASIYRIAFSPDGSLLASAQQNGAATLWTLKGKPEALLQLKGAEGAATALAFSPDGAVLAVGDERGTVRVYR